MVTSGNVGRLCVLGGAQNAAGSRSGSQTVFSRNNASAAPLIVDPASGAVRRTGLTGRLPGRAPVKALLAALLVGP